MHKGWIELIGGAGLLVLLLLVGPIIGAFCWPYALNEWLVFVGKEPSIVWWQGALLGIIPAIGQFSIPVAVITWILMLLIG